MCPPFHGKPWTNEEDPLGLLRAVCMKEGESKGELGVPVTILLSGSTTLERVGGWTSLLLGDKGAVNAFGLEVPTEGGGTPRAKMVVVGVEIPSLELDITLLIGTPIRGELNGKT